MERKTTTSPGPHAKRHTKMAQDKRCHKSHTENYFRTMYIFPYPPSRNSEVHVVYFGWMPPPAGLSWVIYLIWAHYNTIYTLKIARRLITMGHVTKIFRHLKIWFLPVCTLVIIHTTVKMSTFSPLYPQFHGIWRLCYARITRFQVLLYLSQMSIVVFHALVSSTRVCTRRDTYLGTMVLSL